MCLMTNITVAEVIPFYFSPIIHDFKLLKRRVLTGFTLIPGSEDDNLVLVYYKQLGFFLVH